MDTREKMVKVKGKKKNKNCGLFENQSNLGSVGCSKPAMMNYIFLLQSTIKTNKSSKMASFSLLHSIIITNLNLIFS